MEVTRQLLTERASKKGLARIQLTFCWAGQRLRLSSGQKVAPKDWDARQHRAKAKPGTFLGDINKVLQYYTDAATAAEHEATMKGQVLGKEAMRAEIERRYLELLRTASGLPDIPAPPTAAPRAVAEEMAHWVETVVAARISRRTGQRINNKVVNNHRRAALDLASFAQASPTALTYAGIDARFNEAFRNHLLGTLGRSPGTYNHYLGLVRAFLIWAAQEGHPVNRRFREVLQPIEHHTFVESFTEDEVLAIASIDFTSPEVWAYVQQQFPEQASAGPRRMITTAEHLRRLQLTRDKFLLCTYTALRIGDADNLRPAQLHGDVARVKAAKTGVTCIIPLVDDDVFKPASLLRTYAGQDPKWCLPRVTFPYLYLPHVQHLAGITRLPILFHTGRKTFATLKIAQGVPRSQVMMTTGHQTEASFNHYLGINEAELLAWYRRTARKNT
ncbi:tyrosine-type recombinase/integrase [Hymenobacter rubidus]|uniref:tyrosine-type recombinase/integrase n=1 Tax=Hymenobacter rubidus TaxID=1441626 RepID=UPI00191FC299|nr:tyrosine-type recombinase/integrase [Hymenobacter rubidus]